jgi:hypothetical protein
MDWMYPDEKIRKICVVFQRCKHEYLEMFHGLTISKLPNQKQILVENLKVRQSHLAFLEFIINANKDQYLLYSITHPEVSSDRKYYKWFIEAQDLSQLVIEPQVQTVNISEGETNLRKYAIEFQSALQNFLQDAYVFVMTKDVTVQSKKIKILEGYKTKLLRLYAQIEGYKESNFFKVYLQQNSSLVENLKFFDQYIKPFTPQTLNTICMSKFEKLAVMQNMLTLKAAYLVLAKNYQAVSEERRSLAQVPSSSVKSRLTSSTQTEGVSAARSEALPVTLADLIKKREQLESLLDQVKDKIAELKGSEKKEPTVSKKAYEGLTARLAETQEELGRLKIKFSKLEQSNKSLLLGSQNQQTRISSQNQELVRLRSELGQRNQEITSLNSTLAQLQTLLEALLAQAVEEGGVLETIAGSQENPTQESA